MNDFWIEVNSVLMRSDGNKFLKRRIYDMLLNLNDSVWYILRLEGYRLIWNVLCLNNEFEIY